MQQWTTFLHLILVGMLWGVTNPFLKSGTNGIEKIKEKNKFKRIFYELSFLVTNYRYMLPFLINQCGSLIYYYTLQFSDLTLAVPIANSLTIFFTAASSWALKEQIPDRDTLVGMSFIIAGISCYIL